MRVVEAALKMYGDFRRSAQLRWTVLTVVVNMAVTLMLWVGVYRMKVNSELSSMYFLDSDFNSSTGNAVLDGVINGALTIITLGVVSFVMLAFVLYDFRNVVKAWLYFSCVLILFGVSGQTIYDAMRQIFDQETENGQYLTLVFTILPTLIYGTSGAVAFLTEGGSLMLHQFFVVTNCSLISTFYLRAFPTHTTWFVLATVVFWDMFAVLNPMGPLRLVQDKAADYSNNILKFLMFAADEKRQAAGADSIVASADEVVNEERAMRQGVRDLIQRYSKKEAQDEELVQKIRQRRAAWNPDSDSAEISPIAPVETGKEKDKDSDVEESDDSSSSISTWSTVSESELNTASEGDKEAWQQAKMLAEPELLAEPVKVTAADALNDGETVRLGLGDFVFYSLLLGQTASCGCPVAVFFAAIGIVLGLLATLSVLSNDFFTEDATTPALPLPIFTGTIFYFCSRFVWENLMPG